MKPTGTEAQVCEDIARRQQFGLNKYKISVADNPLGLAQWVQHLYEELLDASVYAKRILGQLENSGIIENTSAVADAWACEDDFTFNLKVAQKWKLDGLAVQAFYLAPFAAQEIKFQRLTDEEIDEVMRVAPLRGFRVDHIIRRAEDLLIKKNGGKL